MSVLDGVIDATTSGPGIVHEDHDRGNIDYGAAMGDPFEMLGYKEAMDRGATREEALIAAANARANLGETADGKVAMVSANEIPWHRLGVTVDRNLTSREAWEMVAGWSVEKVQAQFTYNGELKDFDGRFTLVRSDTGAPLGVVTDAYEVIQNAALFDMLDRVVNDVGAHIETAGVTGNGESVWAMSKHSVFEPVPGDEIISYTLATTRHDGSGAGRFLGCGQRVVCANTQAVALGNGKNRGIRITHRKNWKQVADAAILALRQTEDAVEKYAETLEVLARTEAPLANYVNDVLDTVLDITNADAIKGADALAAAVATTEAERELASKRFDRQINRRVSVLEDILERYESETNTRRGSLYGAFNAVTESFEHGNAAFKTRGRNSDDTAARRAATERRFESVMSGQIAEANTVALETAMALVG